jgi:hypothetical protein
MTTRFVTRLFRFLSRPARAKRFEFLLPLNYNDGTLIEAEKFDQTADELCERSGGVTQDTVRITGTWRYGGTRYRDDLFRMRIDTNDPSASEFLRTQKETWNVRFQQIDVWITATEIEVNYPRQYCLFPSLP